MSTDAHGARRRAATINGQFGDDQRRLPRITLSALRSACLGAAVVIVLITGGCSPHPSAGRYTTLGDPLLRAAPRTTVQSQPDAARDSGATVTVRYTLNAFYVPKLVVEVEGDSDMAVRWHSVSKRSAVSELPPTTIAIRAPGKVRLQVSLIRTETSSDTVSSIVLPLSVEPYTDHDVFVSISSHESFGFGFATTRPLAAGIPPELRMLPNDSLFVWWGWDDRRTRAGRVSLGGQLGHRVEARRP